MEHLLVTLLAFAALNSVNTFLIAFLLGIFFTVLLINWSDRQKDQKVTPSAQQRTMDSPPSESMPDLIKSGVSKWISMSDNDIPLEPISHIGYATADDCGAVWLEGRWFCTVSMELSDWSCLQDLLIVFDEIEPIAALYTDSKEGVIQLYFRAVSSAETLLYFADSALM